jgi:hypothetical protein
MINFEPTHNSPKMINYQQINPYYSEFNLKSMLNLLREKNSYYINSILVLYIIYPQASIIIEKIDYYRYFYHNHYFSTLIFNK